MIKEKTDYIGLQSKKKYKCAHCGEVINSYMKNMSEYAYQLTDEKGHTKYYCSWTCFRKAEKELEAKRDKEHRAALLNEFNGVLTLEEAEIMEEAMVYLDIDEVNIRNRKDYEKFYRRHQNLMNLIKGDKKSC